MVSYSTNSDDEFKYIIMQTNIAIATIVLRFAIYCCSFIISTTPSSGGTFFGRCSLHVSLDATLLLWCPVWGAYLLYLLVLLLLFFDFSVVVYVESGMGTAKLTKLLICYSGLPLHCRWSSSDSVCLYYSIRLFLAHFLPLFQRLPPRVRRYSF